MITHSEGLADLAAALSTAQGEFEAVEKGSENPFFRSKYAALPDVVRAATPILVANGLAVSQLPGLDEHGDTLTTILLHRSGQWLANTMRLRPVKNDPQAQGSALTYGRRYAYMAVLGLVADVDDDGNAGSAERTMPGAKAAKPKPAAKSKPTPAADEPRNLTPGELAQIREAAKKAGADWETLGLHLVAIGVDAAGGAEEITKDTVSRAIVRLSPEHFKAFMSRLDGGS